MNMHYSYYNAASKMQYYVTYYASAPALRTKPSLPKQRVRSSLETGLASTAEKTVPSSLMDWCCS